MKTRFLILAGALCATANYAQGQVSRPHILDIPAKPDESGVLNLPPMAASPFLKYKPFFIEPVEGKIGFFRLTTRYADPKQVLTALASKAGNKAVFSEQVINNSARVASSTPKLTLLTRVPLEGTLKALILKVAHQVKYQARFLNNQWEFFPVVYLSESPLPSLPTKPRDFNINPNPGKSIPDNARPFEFNGRRGYFVPVH